MFTALAATALLMGVTGGPHCAVMCGAACAGLTQGSRRSLLAFHGGRLAGYATAGAVAAQAVSSFSWIAQQTAALRPLWMLMHLAVLAWGLTLLVLARQPQWVAEGGRRVWARVRRQPASNRAVFTTGMLWAFMPCGLLYSALVVASFSGGALEGAVAMGLFALGSGLPLAVAPGLLQRLRGWGDGLRKGLGTRVCGLVLAVTAVWALSHNLLERFVQWCLAA